MKRHAQAAFNELEKLGVPVFERSDLEYFGISAEHEESYKWLDYWGAFRGNESYVSEKIEAVLAKHGLFAEWENPGAMSVWDA